MTNLEYYTELAMFLASVLVLGLGLLWFNYKADKGQKAFDQSLWDEMNDVSDPGDPREKMFKDD